MTRDDPTNPNPLIPWPHRELTPQSAALVRRGLDDLTQAKATADRIDELAAALYRISTDPRACAEAAMSIIELGPIPNLWQGKPTELLWALVITVRNSYETGTDTMRSLLGDDYPGKPGEQLRRLLMRALVSLVGPIADPADAVIAALKRGKLGTRIEAAGWLGKYEIHKAAGRLRNALDGSTDVVLTMVLRYALAWLALEDPDRVYSEMVQHAITSSDERLRDRCRYHLFDPPRWVSADTLGRSIRLLAAHEDEQLASLVTYLLTYAFSGSGEASPGTGPTIPLDHCSDPVLDDIISVAFEAFLCDSGLLDRHQGVDPTDYGRVRQIAEDWWHSTGRVSGESDKERGLVMLYRRLVQMIQTRDTRAGRDRHRTPDTPSPRATHATHELAFSYLRRGQLRDAMREYREILRERPEDGTAHFNLGQALRQTGRFDEAIAEFRHALALEFSTDSEAHYNLANTLKQRRLLDQAAAEYREALRLSPALPDTHVKSRVNLGGVLQETGDLDGAINEFRNAVRLAPDSPDAHCNLGGALNDKGEVDEAISEFREALRLRPNHDLAFVSLASALASKGLIDEVAKLVGRSPD